MISDQPLKWAHTNNLSIRYAKKTEKFVHLVRKRNNLCIPYARKTEYFLIVFTQDKHDS